jgi:hypothetical protein
VETQNDAPAVTGGVAVEVVGANRVQGFGADEGLNVGRFGDTLTNRTGPSAAAALSRCSTLS